MIEGTPWFTPPEAIQGSAHIDPRSDLYSLGALGYYLLTGQYIFDAETVPEIHEKQLATAPIPPSQRTTQPDQPGNGTNPSALSGQGNGRAPPIGGRIARPVAGQSGRRRWTLKARVAWWEAYERQPVTSPDEAEPGYSTPMATVKIDLASRME